MQPFLDKLARHLYATHGDNFSRVCLVFPSRRAGLFFKQYVSAIIEKPVWLPDIYALEDFVVYKSGLSLGDPLDLIAKLYKVYKSVVKEKAQPFSEFVSWGNMLLSDFDEIDQYLADGEKVFRYLDEIKALKHWNPDGKPLTPFEQEYLRFYNSLAPCYTLLHQSMLNEGKGYFGFIFNALLTNLLGKSFDEWDKIVFAGFNALTSAEERLLKYLLDKGKAEIFWDADNYYLANQQQEAGHFLREYILKNTFGELNWTSDSLALGKKVVSVVGVPGNVGQAKLAGNLVQEILSKKGSINGVALVLVDESMLLPVLNSIPEGTGDFNVTMGFPLKQTPVFSLINIVMALVVNAKRFARLREDSKPGTDPVARFHYKDIVNFLAHPFIIPSLYTHGGNPVDHAIVTRSFYTPSELLQLLSEINPDLAEVFEPLLNTFPISAGDVVALLRRIISFLKDAFSTNPEDDTGEKGTIQPIELEYLYYAAGLCKKLEVILNDSELQTDIETVQSLVSSLIAGLRLPFYGEPLNGLQVMGMLETRLLDFTDIIMISVNEGLLPRGKHQNTFIPDEVRTQFGLQRYSERTAVFAYHFYRLMQRVENAWLIYNTEGNELGGGEKSRFISQVLYEMPKINPGIVFQERTLSVSPGDQQATGISVAKAPAVMLRLHQMAERGISPTALSTYLKCRLQFYFAHVLRISEPDEVNETIDAATLGEIVHEALYEIYNAVKSSPVTKEVLPVMLTSALSRVRASFGSKFSGGDLTTGKNLLIVKVAENMVKSFLKKEKEYLEETGSSIRVLILEEKLGASIEIADQTSGEVFHVKIHGKADRIDRVGGLTRIIDYKTGKVEKSDLKADQVADILEKEDPAKLLQVLAYAFMYAEMHMEEHLELNSGIVSLRMIKSYFIKTSIGGSDRIDRELLVGFKDTLRTLLEDIFDPSVPFTQTLDPETCKLCVFNAICNRGLN